MYSRLFRIKTLIIKEILVILRDPRGRLMLVVPPLMQLIIFSFAATLEVKNVSVLVLNQDYGKHGHEIIQRLGASESFKKIIFVNRPGEFKTYIDQQKAVAAIQIPADFSRKIESGQGASLQIIFDGRKSNAAQIANSYFNELVNRYNQELLIGAGAETSAVKIVDRHWFNENLDYFWYTIPSLVAILTMVITLSLASMSVAREKELGTFDQLLVSPYLPVEILIGKLIPAIAIGLAEAMLIFTLGRAIFDVPFRGSFALLLLVLFLFSFSIVGFGLFISSLAKTQQQAILGAFIFMVPAITLSGFAAPVENMPLWLQEATWLNPMKHALILLKGLFLKAMPMKEVLTNVWPLVVIGLATTCFSWWFFTRKLE